MGRKIWSDPLLRSAPTIKAMCNDLKSRVSNGNKHFFTWIKYNYNLVEKTDKKEVVALDY